MKKSSFKNPLTRNKHIFSSFLVILFLVVSMNKIIQNTKFHFVYMAFYILLQSLIKSEDFMVIYSLTNKRYMYDQHPD